eukprot:320552-Chlamydomonas_euryale.AAC.30
MLHPGSCHPGCSETELQSLVEGSLCLQQNENHDFKAAIGGHGLHGAARGWPTPQPTSCGSADELRELAVRSVQHELN